MIQIELAQLRALIFAGCVFVWLAGMGAWWLYRDGKGRG